MPIITSIETMLPENTEWQQQCQQLRTAERFTTMVWITFQMGLWLARVLLAGELEQRSRRPSDWPNCPECGKGLRSKGYRPRQIMTMMGVVS